MINKYLLVILAAVISCSNLKAQTPTFLWAGAVGGSFSGASLQTCAIISIIMLLEFH
jgi:hypothetical protein